MALVPHPSGSSSANTDPTKQLTRALKDFESVLSENQRQELHNATGLPDADAVLIFTAELDAKNNKRTKHGISRSLISFLERARDFSTVVDTFVSSNPVIAALVWGSIRLAMTLFANFISYRGETISDVFYELGRLYPKFADYRGLYPASTGLKTALCDFHASVIRFCKHLIEVSQRSFIYFMLQSFEQEFKSDRENIRYLSKIVKDQTMIAKMQADKRDQELQKKDRRQASQSRRLIYQFIQRTDDRMDSVANQLRQRGDQQTWERRKALLDELSTHDHLTPYKQSRRKRFAGTTEWVFQTTEYEAWVDGTGPPLLWCTGKIGSGKTILSASVIDHILTSKNNPNALLAFYFLRFDDQESLLAETAIRSILKQFLDLEEFEGQEQLERAFHSRTGTCTDEILQVLALRIKKMEQSYIVIDGIDEFRKEERNSLFKMLFSIVAQTPNTRLFLSGRQSLTPEIKAKFLSFQSISLDFQSGKSDIELYVNGIIDEKIDNEELHVGSPDLIVDIKKALRDGADGMFLWVAFEVEEICLQHCDEDIRSAIDCLPKDLTEVFTRILLRIVARNNSSIVQKAFRWIGGMKRPPCLDELHEIIHVEIGQEQTIPDRQCNDIQRIASWCENLVTVDEESKIVQFGHHSIREFLLQKSSRTDLQNFHFDLEDVTHYVGEICITYLHFNDLKTTLTRRQQPIPLINPGAIPGVAFKGLPAELFNKWARSHNEAADVNNVLSSVAESGTGTDEQDFNSNHPFLDYARKNWIFHTSNFQEGKSETWPLWEKMVQNGHQVAETPWGDQPFITTDAFKWAMSQHHLALFRLVVKIRPLSDAEWEMLLQLPSDICTNFLDIILHETIIHGPWIEQLFLKVIKSKDMHNIRNFLAAGILDVLDANSKKEALRTAIVLKRKEVLEMLLATKSDLVIFSENGGFTALQTAVRSGDAGIVGMLLAAGASVKAAPSDKSPIILQEAVQLGYADIAELLLAAGVDVNTAISAEGITALQAAIRSERIDMVQILLAAGADIDAVSSDEGITPLQAAVRSGRINMVQMLLAVGADVNATPTDCPTVLQEAVQLGDTDIVKMLLAAGANINAAPSKKGSTALQEAVRVGNTDIVRMLLAARADINAPTRKGSTALQEAVRFGYAHTVQLLLEAGADVNSILTESSSRTALQIAACSGRKNMVRMLLSAGADVNAISAEPIGRTELQMAAEGGFAGIVDKLLTAGADSNATLEKDLSPQARRLLEATIESRSRRCANAEKDGLPSDMTAP